MIQLKCTYCPDKGKCDESKCPIDNMITEIQEMQDFLVITASDNPVELLTRLTDLNVYLARSGKMLADAKAIQDILTANIFGYKGDYISRLSTTLASKFITSQTATINQIVIWLDRINRTCVHQSDNIRTQISFAKMEKQNINRGIGA